MPTAGRKMANSSSSKGSVVRGLLKGQTRSSRDRLMDMTILCINGLYSKTLTQEMNPKTSSEVFTINVKSLADQRLISLTTVESL